MYVLLPIGYHIDLPGAILETLLCLSLQNVLKNQTFAVIDHCLTQKVIATSESGGDRCHQILYPGVQRLLEFLLSKILEGKRQYIGYLRGDIPINQDNPLIYQVLLRLELYLYCFQHFHTLEDVLEAVVLKGGACCLVDHDQGFHCAFYLSGQVDTDHNQV